MTRRIVLPLVFILAAGPALVDAQQPRPEAQERRAALERQVHERFMDQVAERLELTADQRVRLDDLLRSGAGARRELAMESRRLRAELMEAVRDDATPRATFESLLARLDDLREREQALERREANALAGFLDARQQVLFLTMRMHFNERVRGMRGPDAREGRRRPPDRRP